MKLSMLFILLLAFCCFAQRAAYLNLEIGPGFSQEIDNYSNPIVGSLLRNTLYKYSEIIDLNGTLGYDINGTFIADFEVNPAFYTYSKELGMFYDLGIKAKFRIVDMNNYLKLRLGIHQLFAENYDLDNQFGVGINLAGGIELTNRINIELGFKAVVGEVIFRNVPVYSSLTQAQSPASSIPVTNSNVDCNYSIYSIAMRFIYVFRFSVFE
jgi:hypothetical protein